MAGITTTVREPVRCSIDLASFLPLSLFFLRPCGLYGEERGQKHRFHGARR